MRAVQRKRYTATLSASFSDIASDTPGIQRWHHRIPPTKVPTLARLTPRMGQKSRPRRWSCSCAVSSTWTWCLGS